MHISSKELRLHLSDYLDRASRGHTVEISMRGKPIAQLVAVNRDQHQAQDPLFGIWSDQDNTSAEALVRDMRQGRTF